MNGSALNGMTEPNTFYPKNNTSMRIKTKDLIEELVEKTKNHLNELNKLKSLSIENLNYRPGPDKWSILECVEHLNRYGRFYLPEIESRIEQSKSLAEDEFKSGFLGNYFANSMLPKVKLNTMKTFKEMNPIGSDLDESSIQTLIDQQHKTLDLLSKAGSVSMNKTKTSISISKWIKLKLGDTFRVVVYHNYRHMVQIKNITKELSI